MNVTSKDAAEMKFKAFPVFFVLVGLVGWITACKSAQKSLKHGKFDQAVVFAADKLKDNPGHTSSQEALRSAYPRALEAHLNTIKRLEANGEGTAPEALVNEYKALNRLYEQLNSCNACLTLVEPRSFYDQEQASRQQGAEYRYREGSRWLSLGGRDNARKAHQQFEAVVSLVANYKDANLLVEDAFREASFHVVVEQVSVTSKSYQLSHEYFQDQINEFLKNSKRINKFVHFHTPEEAEREKLRPDHVVVLQFDDFVVGQTLLEKNTETVTSKDSVKVGETTVNRQKKPVYGKVTAKLTLHKKTIVSKGLLDMRIEAFDTRKKVHQDKLSGQYTWFCEWASYNGDERALTPEQVKLCKSTELSPPDPQQLFIEFTKPLYEQVTQKLKSFYAGY